MKVSLKRYTDLFIALGALGASSRLSCTIKFRDAHVRSSVKIENVIRIFELGLSCMSLSVNYCIIIFHVIF